MKRVATPCMAMLVALSSIVARADVSRSELDASVDRALTLVSKPTIGRLRNGLTVVVQPLPEQTRVALLTKSGQDAQSGHRGCRKSRTAR
jgi:hypothetical protein